MSTSERFHFSLQPRLDQLREEKNACQAALAKARTALVTEQQMDQVLREKHAEFTQQMHAPLDNSTEGRPGSGPGPAHELIDQGRTFVAFAAEIQSIEQRMAEQREKIVLAEELVKEREQELSRVMSDVQALERLLDRQKYDWDCEVERNRQAEVDNAAIAAWVRRKPPSHS